MAPWPALPARACSPARVPPARVPAALAPAVLPPPARVTAHSRRHPQGRPRRRRQFRGPGRGRRDDARHAWACRPSAHPLARHSRPAPRPPLARSPPPRRAAGRQNRRCPARRRTPAAGWSRSLRCRATTHTALHRHSAGTSPPGSAARRWAARHGPDHAPRHDQPRGQTRRRQPDRASAPGPDQEPDQEPGPAHARADDRSKAARSSGRWADRVRPAARARPPAPACPRPDHRRRRDGHAAAADAEDRHHRPGRRAHTRPDLRAARLPRPARPRPALSPPGHSRLGHTRPRLAHTH